MRRQKFRHEWRVCDDSNRAQGSGMVEVLMAIGALGIILAALLAQQSFQTNAIIQRVFRGELEDLRGFFRGHLSCTNTLTAAASVCTPAGAVSAVPAVSSSGSTIFSAQGGANFAPDFNVRVSCGGSILGDQRLLIEYQPTSRNGTPASGAWTDLFNGVPQSCGLAVQKTWYCGARLAAQPLNVPLDYFQPNSPQGYDIFIRPRLSHCENITLGISITDQSTNQTVTLPSQNLMVGMPVQISLTPVDLAPLVNPNSDLTRFVLSVTDSGIIPPDICGDFDFGLDVAVMLKGTGQPPIGNAVNLGSTTPTVSVEDCTTNY